MHTQASQLFREECRRIPGHSMHIHARMLVCLYLQGRYGERALNHSRRIAVALERMERSIPMQCAVESDLARHQARVDQLDEEESLWEELREEHLATLLQRETVYYTNNLGRWSPLMDWEDVCIIAESEGMSRIEAAQKLVEQHQERLLISRILEKKREKEEARAGL